MTDIRYTYAVARIRALEVSLFNKAAIDQLMACETEQQCLQFLSEKGWGDVNASLDVEAMMECEEAKIWKVMEEVAVDMSVFDVLSYPNLFHNLKAAIKEVCTETENPGIFYDDCSISGAEMLDIVRKKEFSRLPANMVAVAQEAYDTLLHTRDGQLCDVIIDKATLDAVYAAGKAAKDDIVRDYAESTVAIADIKIAVRSQKTGKSLDFMKRAMAECNSISVDQLSKAALSGADAIREYLMGTAYSEGAKALDESSSAFERWCDNRMMQTMQPQKYESFSVGPLFAYVLARENEIKTIRIILSGKQNGFSDEAIRERVREMYV
ncbi:V0D/AC39 family V-type ATPase subunit [Hespellia stercorisuis]|uniref:V/A-type H+-transporting ATPase subunit C n=1 Tax=Hespellia stercorisuis DSM 15480 TaxID=1121950 RepID=A0A1M6J2V5_9FIRM|nr:V-type ATPase subunit [Hespellia stercorisuis]SHJ41028.1 V/A-type H+-transporting ATPase subunit C [Hespellia stercorisuis DSM 15480]